MLKINLLFLTKPGEDVSVSKSDDEEDEDEDHWEEEEKLRERRIQSK